MVLKTCNNCILVLKKNLYVILAILVIIIILFLIRPYTYDFITEIFKLDKKEVSRWEYTKSISYLGGALLLMLQIFISNRRANAAVDRAKVSQEQNIGEQYNNAIEHLSKPEIFTRVGAIYNLLLIYKNDPKQYQEIIFDVLIEYLKSIQSMPSDNEDDLDKEKQIIVDKLFKKMNNSGVNAYGINLSGVDFSEIDFSSAQLEGSVLSGCNLKGCNFDGANLESAVLPPDLEGIKSMRGANIKKIKLGSGTKMNGLQLQKTKLNGAELRYVDLTGANLTNADLTDTDLPGTNLSEATLTNTIGLTFEQLIQTKSLYKVVGLDKNIENKLKKEKPELFNQPKK